MLIVIGILLPGRFQAENRLRIYSGLKTGAGCGPAKRHFGSIMEHTRQVVIGVTPHQAVDRSRQPGKRDSFPVFPGLSTARWTVV